MKGMIKIDIERCKGCAYCAEACPVSVIAMSNYFNKSGFPILSPNILKNARDALPVQTCEVAIEAYRDNHRN